MLCVNKKDVKGENPAYLKRGSQKWLPLFFIVPSNSG